MKEIKAIKQASLKLGLPYDYVYKIYVAYWKYIKQHIASLPLKEKLTEEEYDSYKHSVSLPFLGKLHCPYDKLKFKQDKYEKNCSKRN